MLSTDKTEIPEDISNDDALNNLQIDRSFIVSTIENVAASINNEPQSTLPPQISSISADHLHRRNPRTVRQEIQSFDDDVIPDTTLADVQLNEMPGLQNTEQWKRIAARSILSSPPLSHQYYQTTIVIPQQQDGQISVILPSNSRPEGTEIPQDTTPVPSLLQTQWRKILFGVLFSIIIIAIIVAVVVAVILVREPGETATDYYPGSIIVQASFDPTLLSSSTLAKNYEKEFCSLISSALVDTKTKYAIFYSTCTVNNFRNGSIIGDFILGFTRYQNITRLNTFLNRTIVNQQLFGGTILSIIFNITYTGNTNDTDYSAEYDDTRLVNLDTISSSSTTKLDPRLIINTKKRIKDKLLPPDHDLSSTSEDWTSGLLLQNDIHHYKR